LIEFATQTGDFGEFCSGVFTATFALADQLGERVATGLKFFSPNLHGLTPGFERTKRVHIQRDTAGGEPLGDGI